MDRNILLTGLCKQRTQEWATQVGVFTKCNNCVKVSDCPIVCQDTEVNLSLPLLLVPICVPGMAPPCFAETYITFLRLVPKYTSLNYVSFTIPVRTLYNGYVTILTDAYHCLFKTEDLA